MIWAQLRYKIFYHELFATNFVFFDRERVRQIFFVPPDLFFISRKFHIIIKKRSSGAEFFELRRWTWSNGDLIFPISSTVLWTIFLTFRIFLWKISSWSKRIFNNYIQHVMMEAVYFRGLREKQMSKSVQYRFNLNVFSQILNFSIENYNNYLWKKIIILLV